MRLLPTRACRAGAAAACLLLATASHAADLMDAVQQRGRLRVAVEPASPPYGFKDDKGRLTGFGPDLAQALAARLGVKPVLLATKGPAAVAGLRDGKVDAIVAPGVATSKQRVGLDASGPYAWSQAQFVVREDDRRSYKSVTDLAGRKIGVVEGSGHADFARGLPQAAVKTYPDVRASLTDLAEQRIDVAIHDSLVVHHAASAAKLPVRGMATLGEAAPVSVLFREGNPKFKAAVDKALADMKADGSYARISQTWFGRDVSQPLPAR